MEHNASLSSGTVLATTADPVTVHGGNDLGVSSHHLKECATEPSYINFRLLTLYQTTKSWTCPDRKHLQTTVLNVTQKLIFFLENFVGKEENAGYQHFLLSPQWFHIPFFA